MNTMIDQNLKKWTSLCLGVLMCWLLALTCSGDEEESIPLDEVPENVLKALEQNAPPGFVPE